MYVVATAGHVDHGKSTLVRALTGMEPDRWAEERRRGLTIDLGFCWTTLPNGEEIAFVDVPGHERFLTNMLAGVGPVPAVLLVVAADQGWSRQTAEHVAALDALGVRHGVLALTRSDLGDAELAEHEAREHLAGTSLEGIEAVAVSSVTGAGVVELAAALQRLTQDLPGVGLPTRLWVDRVFTVRGSGVVVTGTLSTGSIAQGDELLVAATGHSVVVRSMECLKKPVESAHAVARVALNLRGVKADEIGRGDALVFPREWLAVRVMDARLTTTGTTLPTEAILHLGSAAASVHVRPLGPQLVRLTLSTPVPVRVGERGLLRAPGSNRAMAGFTVLDVDPTELTRRGDAARRATELAGVDGPSDPVQEVRRRGAVKRVQLERAGVLHQSGSLPDAILLVGEWLVDAELWAEWKSRLPDLLDARARSRPLAPGLPKRSAVSALNLPDPALLEPLIAELAELTLDAEGVHRTTIGAVLPPEVEHELTRLLDRLLLAPFGAPSRAELDAAGLHEPYLAIAVRQGRLLRIARDVVLGPEAVEECLRRLSTLPQPFSLGEARDVLQTTRRVAVPLLDLLDRRGLTRMGEDERRVLR